MTFRGKCLHDGKTIVRRAEVELERSVQDGVEDWKGAFIGPVKMLLEGQTYQLVLDNGRSADIQLQQKPIDSPTPEKVNFTVAGGFR